MAEPDMPPPHPSPRLVPVHTLNASHRAAMRRHLKALEAHDRYLRFGYFAQDAQIDQYLDTLDFEQDEVFGIYNRKLDLIALAHLALTHDPRFEDCAEFGVSVLPHARARGYGTLLFQRAVRHARNEGVHLLFIHALSENAPMLKIAVKAGATIERDGTESEAYLYLPPSTLDTRLTEIIEEQVGLGDYRLKVRAKQYFDFLRRLQELRGVLGGGNGV